MIQSQCTVSLLLSRDLLFQPLSFLFSQFRSFHVFCDCLPSNVIYSLAAYSTEQQVTINIKFVLTKLSDTVFGVTFKVFSIFL